MAQISIVRKALKEECGTYLSRNDLYRALCDYNTNKLNIGLTLGKLNQLLIDKKDEMCKFSDFIIDEFEPIYK